jgi:Na+:H+ antiporter, NhaA family
MVFFFGLATKEIMDATLPGGAMVSLRHAAVPLLAAVGGMAGPAILYIAQINIAGRPELMRGWAIPCATDVAFSYMAIRLIFHKNHAAVPFLVLLAIADDALSLFLLAFFYPAKPLALFHFALLMAPAIGLVYWLKRRGVRNFWLYVCLGGALSWMALEFGGLHPALALVPIVPFMPHEKRHPGSFSLSEHGVRDTMNRFEDWWRIPVQIILFLFGLANAGVPFSRTGSGTWIVLSSLLIGKPVGIVLMTLAAAAVGLRAPGKLRYLDIATVGVAAGVGFTVALFFATAAFEPGVLLDEVKMGALFSFAAAPLAVILGRAVSAYRKRTAH